MSYLVISTSLNPNSRSRILAQYALQDLENSDGVDAEWIDLSETPLPQCDGMTCYSDPNVVAVAEKINNAEGILLATPIYNYSYSSSAKNLIELTGSNWTNKVVGFLCAAGGPGSYMAIMNLANYLMLDFRSVIVPRFVYTQGDAFSENKVADEDVQKRIEELAKSLIQFSTALELE
jgi:NAD(P)H-dependent FMN reductase